MQVAKVERQPHDDPGQIEAKRWLSEPARPPRPDFTHTRWPASIAVRRVLGQLHRWPAAGGRVRWTVPVRRRPK
jgi:hypothetical protein